jgi:hypothetical protein
MRAMYFIDDSERAYMRFIIVKIFLEIFFCSTGIYYKDFLKCTLISDIFGYECLDTGSYLYLFYKIYIHKFLYIIFYFMIGLNEIFILYDRYFILTSTYNWFSEPKNFKKIILFSFIIVVSMYSPLLLENEIVKFSLNTNSSSNVYYSNELSSIGKLANFSLIFELINFFLVNFFLKCFSIFLTVVAVRQFRSYFEKAKREIDFQANLYTCSQIDRIKEYEEKRKKTENKLLKLVITMNVLYVVSRTFQSIYVLVTIINPEEKAMEYVYLQSILINICNISIYLLGSLNVLVLSVFNKKFKRGLIITIKDIIQIFLEIFKNWG